MLKKHAKVFFIGLTFLCCTQNLLAQADTIVQATILESDSVIADKLYNSGVEKLSKQQFEQAITDFTQAIDKNRLTF